MGSSDTKQWMRRLKCFKIGLKELIALKLYLDFDDLQREFRKIFRLPYNNNSDRLSSFYHWNKLLIKTFAKLNKVHNNKQYKVLYHGVSNVTKISSSFNGKCFGPLSTTTDIDIARSFAGDNGMILQIKPNYDKESNQSFVIEKVILSKEFDATCKWCNQTNGG